ncbi:DUF58 domain-containing protein [Haloarcula montana]|uniref:DUF58 domain-containing protein n=1 Tax=Haloarcula montana TaxID=3111776 RepID=UPI002D78876E|nr:DUF58 domain-containing protein [Haloarcula sp. GH36]
MTARSRPAVLVGVLAAAGGLTLALVPGGTLLPRVVATLATVAVGLAAVLLAADRLFGDDESSVTLPTPETRPAYSVPGTELRELLTAVGLVGRRRLADAAVESDEPTPRERLRASLQCLGEDVLSRVEGLPRAAANERLRRGDWTDDPAAGAFFAGDLCPPLSRWAYLPGRGGELPIVERACHAVTALADRADGGTPRPDARLDPPAATGGDTDWPPDDLPRERTTGRTRLVVAAVLLASAVGTVLGYPGTVLTATLGVSLAGAAKVWSPVVELTVSRSLDATTPAPGEAVTVTVTVENVGTTTLPDVRLIDGVPTGLTVADGHPRFTTALRPGRARTVSYTVRAVPGRHTFDPATVVVGDIAGATETVTTVGAADGPTELHCGFGKQEEESVERRSQVTLDAGQQVADASGSGVEFDTLREYRPGDPPARIDWHHRAKTGDLATVELREPRLARVAVVVDTRPAAYVAASPGGVPAPRHAAVAADAVVGRLLAEGVPVGLATTAGDCWRPPRAGDEQRAALRTLLAGGDAVPWRPVTASATGEDVASSLAARFDPDVQVLFVSPMCDDESVNLARRLELAGNDTTVVSPDCTDAATVEGVYGRLVRRQRLSTLRSHGIPVTDWDPAEELGEVCSRVPLV